jgi:DNA repair exonuclease SbcCD ATPase subunit
MKDIRLVKLTLHNFQGGSFVLDADGQGTSIYARNGAGKTRLMSAFTWLLFNKDSLGRSDFSIKNTDANGEAEHNLHHSVEAVLTVDGDQITLKKTYYELWVKKRGSAEAIFSGHTNEFHINGVPCQKNEFDNTVKEIAGSEETFRLLTNPSMFPVLPWQRQRAILLEICGDISEAEVIASNESLSPLTELLAKYKNSKTRLDDLRKVIAARRAEINKELPQTSVRIDEVKRGLPDVTGLDQKAIIKEAGVLETAVNDAKLRLQGVDNGGTIADLSKELQGLRYDISQLENKYYLEGIKHVVAMNAKINELASGKHAKETHINSLKTTIELNQRKVAGLEGQLLSLREKWTAIDAETFQNTTNDTCPACGQALPTERVQEALAKAIAQFNQDKAERLLQVETRGKELRGELDSTIPIIERLHAELMEAQETGVADEHDMLVAERDILKARAEDYTPIPGRPEMLERMAAIEKQIEEARKGVSADKDQIQHEIADLTAQLAEAKEKADRFTRREQGSARIEELKAEEKKLTTEFEKLEAQLYLTDTFIKTKVAMLTSKINEKFEVAHFKLFSQNINGGVEPCCEMLVGGIGYNSGLNSAARTQGGMDAIRVLQSHHNLACPIFVDNRESVTDLPEMSCQLISLIVSPKDKVLRVETAQKRIAA